VFFVYLTKLLGTTGRSWNVFFCQFFCGFARRWRGILAISFAAASASNSRLWLLCTMCILLMQGPTVSGSNCTFANGAFSRWRRHLSELVGCACDLLLI
jgi:hypothetical protein